MIQSKLAALLLATASVGAGPMLLIPSTAQAQADVEVSFDFFNDSLSPYGEWVEVGDYGLCWRPNDVGDDWAPYTDGYWSYTDAGWTWVSYEDFGGVVYHYGRWVNVEDEGWCWVPDYEWGPAWVSWRNNDDYVGWAPLPPEARWEPSVGFSVWVDNSYDIGPSYYNFCSVEDFGAPVIREVILPRPRNVVIIGNTVNITNITVNNFIGVPFCGGPRFDVISHRVRRPIPALKLVRETNITNIYNNTVINKTVIKNDNRRVRAIHSVQQGNQLIVAAPRIKRVANPLAALPQIKPKRAIPAAKVRKGWNLVQDPEQRTRLKQKFAQETKGLRPETAPARAIQTAELKPVPEKADPNAPSPVVTGRRGNRNGKNDRDDRPDKTERAAQVQQPMNPAVVPGAQTADANDDKPGKLGRGKDRKDREEKAGVAAGERSPLKPFNGGNAPLAPGGGKNRRNKPDGVADVERPAPAGAMDPAGDSDRQKPQEKLNKEKDQVARAAEIQEEFRKRQREQAQAGRMENKPDKAEKADKAERAERRQEAQAAAAEIRREQQARAAQKEAAREQAADAQADRQREAMAERLRESRREQQQDAQERRQQRMQSEAFQRRANQAQDGAAEMRRQQAQAQAAAAAQARREQMQAMQRQQAARHQQAEAQQERAQAMRQQQMQIQRQMQRQQMQAQPQMPRPQMQAPQQHRGGGGGGGKGEGRGRDGRGDKKD